MTNDHDTQEKPGHDSRFSPALLIAGVVALAIAFWGVVGGPSLVSAGTLAGILAIGAVAVAGVVLIARPGGTKGPDGT